MTLFCLLSLAMLNICVVVYSLTIHAETPKVTPEIIKLKEKPDKAKIYDEVFGIDYNEDFEVGYYEPLVDTDLPLSPVEQLEIKGICKEYGVSYELVLAIMYQESRFQRDAKNGPCKGAMQLNSHFHKVDDYFDIIQNAEGGCKFLRTLLDDYEDEALALMIWHGETDAISKYKKGVISTYARQILERRDYYAEKVKPA